MFAMVTAHSGLSGADPPCPLHFPAWPWWREVSAHDLEPLMRRLLDFSFRFCVGLLSPCSFTTLPSSSKQGIPKQQPLFCWTSHRPTHQRDRQWLKTDSLEFWNAVPAYVKSNTLSPNMSERCRSWPWHVPPRPQDAKQNLTNVLAQLYLGAKLTASWLTALHIQGVLVPRRMKKKNVFFVSCRVERQKPIYKSMKIFYHEQRGQESFNDPIHRPLVGCRLSGRAREPAGPPANPLGQSWDETDKMIMSNETQIFCPVWIRTIWGLFSSFFLSLFLRGVPYWSWIWRETVQVGS